MAFNIKMTMNSHFSDNFCYHKIQDNNRYKDANDRLPENKRILFYLLSYKERGNM